MISKRKFSIKKKAVKPVEWDEIEETKEKGACLHRKKGGLCRTPSQREAAAAYWDQKMNEKQGKKGIAARMRSPSPSNSSSNKPAWATKSLRSSPRNSNAPTKKALNNCREQLSLLQVDTKFEDDAQPQQSGKQQRTPVSSYRSNSLPLIPLPSPSSKPAWATRSLRSTPSAMNKAAWSNNKLYSNCPSSEDATSNNDERNDNNQESAEVQKEVMPRKDEVNKNDTTETPTSSSWMNRSSTTNTTLRSPSPSSTKPACNSKPSCGSASDNNSVTTTSSTITTTSSTITASTRSVSSSSSKPIWATASLRPTGRSATETLEKRPVFNIKSVSI